MKNYFIFVILLFTGNIFCQTGKNKKSPVCKPQWTVDNPGQLDVFVKNYGQFDHLLKPTNEKASYVINNNDQVFFTPHGYIWKLNKISSRPSSIEKVGEVGQERPAFSEVEREEELKNLRTETYFITMSWQGANPNAQLIAEEEAVGYYTYGQEAYRDLKAKGYRKLIYKELYPGIDVEYIIPNSSTMKGGIKYSLIVKRGADISKIKMYYKGDVEKIEMDTEGNIVIKTPAGDMIDHAPKSFYTEGNNHPFSINNEDKETVASSFELKGNMVSFKIHGYQQPTTNLLAKEQPNHEQAGNKQQILIIDPWTIVPNLSGGYGPYDVDYDKYGNIYIDFSTGMVTGSGTGASCISKYSPGGGFLWTIANFNTSTNYFYSDFCVMPSGSVFTQMVCESTLYKISSSGLLLTSKLWPNSLNDEGWVVAYNKCINTLLIGGGGTLNLISLRMGLDTALAGTITGNNFNGGGGVQSRCNDIARMLIDDNGEMYSFFTNGGNQAGTKNKIFRSSPPYNTFSASQLRPSCAFGEINSIPRLSNRLNVMDINSTYLYFFDGQNLEARNKTTLNLISSITVSASYACGGPDTGPTDYKNEGIAVDNCNNIYVGGQKLVHVFNFNGSTFTTLPTIAVPGNVYDIMLDKANQLIYVTGDGFLNSIDALPCGSSLLITPLTSGCGSNGTASVSVSGGNPPYTYQWSNGNTSNPINALPGRYTVTVTDSSSSCKPSQSDTAVVTIMNASGLTAKVNATNPACSGGTGSASVTSTGTGPFSYIWSNGQTSETTTSLVQGIYTVTITDGSSCTFIATTTITQPPALVASTTHTDVLCNGINVASVTDSITAFASGGTPGYNYSWSNGSYGQTASNFSVGNYTVTVTDINGCSSTTTVALKDSVPTIINVSPADQIITQGNSVAMSVSGGNIYTWAPAIGLSCTNCSNPIATPTVTTAYSVTTTDANGCKITARIIITVNLPCIGNERDLFIANVFSPNNDGKNDELHIEGNGLSNIYWAIYDRWGNQLFEAFDQMHPWDGTKNGNPMETGTYTYFLKATCNKTNKEVKLKGNVSIVK